MAAGTVTGDVAVIEPSTSETIGVVAVITGIAALYMVGWFTQCHATVMAVDTAALNLGMVDPNNRFPAAWGMAGFTEVGAGDVVAWLAGGLTAVMTADAAAGDTAVIKDRISKAVGIVAIVAGITALDMVGRLAGCCITVMAADTATLNFSMIHPDNRCPATWGVAGFAEVGAGYMVARFAGGRCAVMAADAVTGDTAVVEGGTSEAISVVAIVTGIATWWVVGRFARRNATVMTTDTAALNFSMIHPDDWRPAAWRMAGLAEVGAGDMVGRFARRLTAVVTADTVTGDAAVVEGRTSEAVGVVAVIAGI